MILITHIYLNLNSFMQIKNKRDCFNKKLMSLKNAYLLISDKYLLFF